MTQSPRYSAEFFAERHAKTLYSAQTILRILWSVLPDVCSAIDVGCGVGTWLSVLRERGVARILGIDGSWVARNALVIPQDCFSERDLAAPLRVTERFDLAICLEVAEHLPAACADRFIRELTGLADIVLFSAAIPGQGGVHHVNEQWPEYWNERFQDHGFTVCDVIRPRIWRDAAIPFWYRQNTLLFAKTARYSELRQPTPSTSSPLSIVHPELYLRQLRSIRQERSARNNNS